MEVASLSRHLESFSLCVLKAVVSEQAMSGLFSIHSNSAFLSKIAGFNVSIACVCLVVLYVSEVASAVALCLPVVKERPIRLAVVYGLLSFALVIEAAIAFFADDHCMRTKAIFLAAACTKHAISTACSRRLRMYAGSVGDSSVLDAISATLREHASRYKLAPTAFMAVSCVLVFTLLNSENPLSSAPLSRMLGRSQYARGLAVASLLSAIGSEDRSRVTLGRKKSI
jgi:hypothetical protein